MKTLLLKLFAGLAAIAALQIPVGYLVREPDNLPFDRVRRAIPTGADTLLLGDSVLGFETKADPVSLLERIRRGAGREIASNDGPGYTPELHLAALVDALRRGAVPKLVVLSINPRSFGEYWDQGLQYQFSELRARLHHGDVLALGLQRPMASYQLYAVVEGYPRSEEAFQNLRIEREGRSVGTIREILKRSYNLKTPEARGLAFSLLYQKPLDPRHRKVRALEQIADLCRSSGIRLLAYVTPIDVEAGERTVGPTFRPRVASNVEVLRKALEGHGVALTDWSTLFPSGEFSYDEYPNDHLGGAGRQKLAENLIGWMSR